jgi:PAS domain S-box-containing protein/diguanylate cyclase (GGDEF)-like protein
VYTPHVAVRRPAWLARALIVVVPILIADAVAMAIGVDSELPAAFIAVGVVTAGYGASLIRRSWRTYRGRCNPGRGQRWISSGLFGVGFFIVAATFALDAAADLTGAAPNVVARLSVAGLSVAMLAMLPALLLMPGANAGPMAGARRALEGVSVGICLLFTTWVLMISPFGRVDDLAFWVSLVTCCGLASAVICALASVNARRAAVACAGGVVATIVGLDGIAFAVANGPWVAAPTVLAAVVSAGAVLTSYGAGQLAAVVDAPLPATRATFAIYPVLAVPAVVAVQRLAIGGKFDAPAILLGVVGCVVFALRESLAALHVSRYARELAGQEAKLRNLVAGSSDVIMVLDGDLIVRWQSPAAQRQFGLTDCDVVGRHFTAMVHPADAVAVEQRLAEARAVAGDHPALVEARLRDGHGRWRETESSVSDQRDVPEVGGIVVHVRDIGERKEMERTLQWLAHADPLTGLANRRQLLLSIKALRSGRPARGALLLLELNGLAEGGDALLVEVARRLRASVGADDVCARLSGREFAVVTEAAPVAAYALATRLVGVLREPFPLPDGEARLTVAVGLAEIAGGADPDDLVRRADLALRRAKQHCPGGIEWYDEAIEQALLRRMSLEVELPGALKRGELDVIYQPILDLVAGRPLGVEALLRWRHPRLGTLLPAEFIPVAEDLGLMNDIGGWVLDCAIRQLACWLREGRDLYMGVNVSPRQLGDDLPRVVRRALAAHAVPAERLIIELAERRVGETPAPHPATVQQRLGELRSLGVRTALDEFGIGVESLTHLRQFPVDMVKVGRSFFADTSEYPGQSVPIIDVMVGLGRRLGIEVVAQGLEAPAHLELVRTAGCTLGQGHLFARPQPAEHLEAYLEGLRTR